MRVLDTSPAANAAETTASPAARPAAAAVPLNGAGNTSPDRIGVLLAAATGLTAEQIERVEHLQRERGMRFGEAAVALGLVSEQDVASALANQYRYAVITGRDAKPHASLVMATEPYSEQAEAFRSIRAQLKLKLAAPSALRRPIAVLSTRDGDGRSYFAANLAVAFSQLGERTLLIDADLRRPSLHELFELDDETGLSSVLSGRIEAHTVHRVDGLPHLFVLPVGPIPPNPLELVESVRFANLLAGVMQKFDHVIVDTSAFEHGMDGPVVGAHCGLALVVVRAGQSKLAPVQDLIATLARGMTDIAGVVLNER
jgi:chain length determinant protein tyrosine kinase EpsG